ncbi:MAG: UvrD-helicase domain-containing protein, partial [Clostridia bacterium]|nr:UvrD-helicase domain-containing protein [Clostridia bacterium]
MRQLEEKWTPAQKDAIRSRGETLLVSAAAGSGKTAVLTERIIDRLLDEENPLDLSRILVVTFTKAAAGELKSRIRDALNREIAKAPDNHRLRTQLLNVGRAKISTIDSFCLDLIRTNFAALSLSPKVSVADEAQAKLLAKTVMEGLIDDHFDGLITDETNFIPDFGDLCDLFVTTRSAEELAKVLLELYDKVDNFEDGILWLKKQAENLDFYADADFLAKDNPLSAPLRSRLTAWTEAGDAFYQRAGLFLTDYPEYAKNYGESFSYMGGWFSHLHTLLSDGASYDAVRQHFAGVVKIPSLKGVRGDKASPESIRFKETHQSYADQLKNEFRDRFFSMSQGDIAAMNHRQALVIDGLYRLLSLFENRLTEEKRRRQILDFGDMKRYALRLLWDGERNCPTEAARQEALKYDEIYIDEYQDVSPVQDRIFSSIANKDNRFM